MPQALKAWLRNAQKSWMQPINGWKTSPQKDGLTGLFNRRHFDETLPLMWRVAQQEAKTLFLILFDVDYFKQFNDMYGHQAGDDLSAARGKPGIGLCPSATRHGVSLRWRGICGAAGGRRKRCAMLASVSERLWRMKKFLTPGVAAHGLPSVWASPLCAILPSLLQRHCWRRSRCGPVPQQARGRSCTFESQDGELLK